MVDSSRDDTSAVTLATLRMTTTALLATTDEEALIASRLDELLAAFDPTSTADREFWGAQFDLGLAWVSFPRWRRRARSEPSTPTDRHGEARRGRCSNRQRHP